MVFIPLHLRCSIATNGNVLEDKELSSQDADHVTLNQFGKRPYNAIVKKKNCPKVSTDLPQRKWQPRCTYLFADTEGLPQNQPIVIEIPQPGCPRAQRAKLFIRQIVLIPLRLSRGPPLTDALGDSSQVSEMPSLTCVKPFRAIQHSQYKEHSDQVLQRFSTSPSCTLLKDGNPLLASSLQKRPLLSSYIHIRSRNLSHSFYWRISTLDIPLPPSEGRRKQTWTRTLSALSLHKKRNKTRTNLTSSVIRSEST